MNLSRWSSASSKLIVNFKQIRSDLASSKKKCVENRGAR